MAARTCGEPSSAGDFVRLVIQRRAGGTVLVMVPGDAAFSIGHGTASEDELVAGLGAVGVRRLVDIRTAPGSRRSPHLGRDRLEQWLPRAGVAYRWEPRLGGFRTPPPDSPDIVWRNKSFRGYAAHLRSEAARVALEELVADATAEPTAFMCSETVWWRCHRRLVADALQLVYAVPVMHLMQGRLAAHRPTDGARRIGDTIVYDAPEDPAGCGQPSSAEDGAGSVSGARRSGG